MWVTDGRYPCVFVLLTHSPSSSTSLPSLSFSFPPSLFLHLYCDNGSHLVFGPWTGAKQFADLWMCLYYGFSSGIREEKKRIVRWRGEDLEKGGGGGGAYICLG